MNRKSQGVLATALALCSTLSCSDKSADVTGIALNDSTAASALAVTNPAPVTDLQAAVTGGTSVTLSFTQVNDGTGQPAKYDVRYAAAPISWGSATSTTNGTCTTPLAGTAIGSQLSCTVLGLTPATNYNFQLVAFRGTLNLNAVFGSLSSIASATTTASAPPPPAPVASVSVLPATSTLQIGATVQLQVTAHDANGNVLTGRVVTSSSADTAIASVNSLGLVTAISAGTTQITVTSEGKSAIATITVTAPTPAPPPPAPAPVASVTVSPASSTLLIGATVQLLVTAVDANGNVLTGRVVTSSSANAAIASVNSLGLVTAVSAGTTQITVTSEGKSAVATITVSATPPPVTNPSAVTNLQAAVTGSTSVTLSFTQVNDGTGQPAKYDVRYAVAPISWGSATSTTNGTCTTPLAGTAIGSQLSCTVLGLTPATNYNFQLVAFRGTLNLNAVFGSLSSIASATTTATAPPPPVPVASVSVSPASSTLEIGATVQLQVTALDANNNVLTGRVVTSSSANPAIASVNSLGLVTAVGAGTTQITVTSEGKSAIATITVSAPAPVPVASVTVTPASATLQIGATVQLQVTAFDANNNALTGRVVTSSSANPAVASVNSLGLVTAVSSGTTLITVTSEGKSATAAITVNAPAPVPVASVSVSPTSPTLQVGTSVQLSAVTRDGSNNVLTGRVVTWGSSSPAIASVNANGMVTAVAAGSAMITATSETKTGTDAVTATAPAPVPVASVAVSPASYSLLVGATVQLSATTRDANNNVLTGRAITWSSPNSGIASVSSNGLVTAIGAGSIQITATSEGRTGSSSVTVTIPAPPPPQPPPGSTNEPSGMTLLNERPFNSLTENAGWITQGLTITQDATAPKSPTSVIRATYQTGFVGGSAPGVAEFSHPGHRVLYISYWAKLSSNFWGHLTSVNKQFYEWGNGIGLFYFEAAGVGSDPLEPRVVLQGTPADAVLGPNLVPSARIPRGVWYNVEVVLNGNSSGAADGTVDWWLNGVHVGSYSGRQFTSGATSWGIFQFEPVWGGITDSVPATMTQDWDHLYISGKN